MRFRSKKTGRFITKKRKIRELEKRIKKLESEVFKNK